MGPMPRGSHEPRVHGSWGPELAGGSRSIPSSPVFVQRSRTAPRTPPSPGPTHLIPLPCGTCPPVTSPGDPAVPRCAHCCHRAQVSWVRDHLCSSGRQRLPTRFDLLPTGPWKDLPSPHSSETLHPWAQPFLHTSTDRGRTGRPPTLGGGSPHCVAREGTHPEFQKRPWHRWDEGATPVPPQLSPRPHPAACGPGPGGQPVAAGPQTGEGTCAGPPRTLPARGIRPLFSCGGAGSPLHPRLVSELQFLERAQGPARF